ncbi:hypothetical protein [Spiroplasma citri]|uniref:Uncharacterized protein n=1 Tax=Spiroplasma citri TaxID=2133 RepID=A0AAJ4JYT4_SPICI|nr:hypothetical protein [Spiroplasma citri]APE75348.1 hypothetical protein SCITRI_001473 [Spiroplasma citri]QIA67570.1 hypothetical protein GMI18_08070 [Spiroplasma citri]QIA69418.1 hypothetical protein GL298_07985 [Spiroplasma citri]QIA71283.1 hypothetical protein GL981_08020 [Spiroplasma citri]QIA73418.1 hypothetical protein GL982_07295 [Spiroplasma citri]
MNITELIKFEKLQEENELLKNEITELKQQILYKEDFYFQLFCINCEKVDECILSNCSKNTLRKNYVLSDSSKYDKLPSKED